MTYPPYQPPTSDNSRTPGAAWGPGAAPSAPGWTAGPPAAPPRRSRRGLAVGAVVAGVVVLGGAGDAAASYLSGGGTQPEDVLPADTLGFVKVDLDPSASQKLALHSLLAKFPDVHVQGARDVRGQVLDPLLSVDGGRLDFARDVQPWLGNRMAVAAVPAAESPVGVAPVVALAFTDEGQMTDALERAHQGADFGYAVRDGFVLITDTQQRADDIVADKKTLADDEDFAGDRDALGGDQFALVWADLAAAQHVLAAQGGPEALPGGVIGGQNLSGRVILGVHAQDDGVEMVGRDFGASDTGAPKSAPTRLVQGLPDDTLAALSVAGLGDRVGSAWDEMAHTGALAQVEQPLAQLGLHLPEDLTTVLGQDLVVAVFGDIENPGLGAKVLTDDPRNAARKVAELLAQPGHEVPALFQDTEGGYLAASDPAALDAVAAGGNLGDTKAFRAAVADPDSANAVGYVDLARVVDRLIAEGGDTGQQAAKFRAVRALGFSATGTDDGGRFVLRITTR